MILIGGISDGVIDQTNELFLFYWGVNENLPYSIHLFIKSKNQCFFSLPTLYVSPPYIIERQLWIFPTLYISSPYVNKNYFFSLQDLFLYRTTSYSNIIFHQVISLVVVQRDSSPHHNATSSYGGRIRSFKK